ncbi:25S rRNA (cytosine-C(5))-methyltransferase nop2-like [Varroa destructor]|uniref:SAM-dependent MTase RsmB/NOP-type domain-containing protein n=1 Tax=Varroa destructor TaxID=109461 RepID=A0A7M7KZ22_VARDE|nr:25S rRNA (cytosine-C(5))-methyltransferase nop2-like [Varroa destructor]
MGRKANYDEKPKRGKGRKSRVQPPPPLLKQLKAKNEHKKLSRNQLKRLKKRHLKGRLSNDGAKKNTKKPASRLDNSEAEPEAFEEFSDKEEQQLANMDESMENDDKTKAQEYTDDNKNWLKPKTRSGSKGGKALFDESDDDNEGVMDDDFTTATSGEKKKHDGVEGEVEDFSDAEEMHVERKAKELLKKQQEDAKLEKDELEDTKRMGGRFSDDFRLPTAEEVAREQEEPQDMATIQQRIKDILYVLADLAYRGETGRPRRDYLEQLSRDFCTYYSYNDFLMERLMQLFMPGELAEFLEANQVQRPITIRTNTLKTRRRELAQALLNRGVNLDPLGEWSKEGLVIYNSQVPVGATPEYLAGHYMLQGAASMLPVLALAPRESEKVLDLCAAPGGKSAHIGALMKNTGVLFVNDVQPDRCKAIIANLHRLGVTNAVVSAVDGRKFSKIMTGFDRVLVDAPCSGSGVMSKDERVKTSKDAKDILRCAHLQRELLLTAIDCVDAFSPSGGYIVYSTCSVLPEENECVVDYAVKHRHVEIVDTGLKFGREGLPRYREHRFGPQMNLAKRFYPHTHNMEGFFIVKLRKVSNGPKLPKKIATSPELTQQANKAHSRSENRILKKSTKKAQQTGAEGNTKPRILLRKKQKLLENRKKQKSRRSSVVNGKLMQPQKAQKVNDSKGSVPTFKENENVKSKVSKKALLKKNVNGAKKKLLQPLAGVKKFVKRSGEALA